MATHDVSSAIVSFGAAVKLMPLNAEAHYRIGSANLTVGNGRIAAEELQKAVQLDPEHWQAHLKLAEMKATSSDSVVLAEAEHEIIAALERFPRDADALGILGIVEWKLGRPAEAKRALERSLQLTPGQPNEVLTLARMELGSGDVAAAEKLLRQTAETSATPVPLLIALAEFYTVSGQDAAAEKTLCEVLVHEPHKTAALLDLAALYMRGNRLKDADRIYSTISALPDKRYRSAHGIFLLETGNLAAAIAELQTLLKRQPDDHPTRGLLVNAYMISGRFSEARSLLNSAITASDKDAEALFQKALVDYADRHLNEAQSSVMRVLRLRPDLAEAHYLLAEVHRQRGAILNEQNELRQALELNPSLLPARMELAGFLLTSNAPQVAFDLLAQAPGKRTAASLTQQNWARMALDWSNPVEPGQVPASELALQQALSHLKTGDLTSAARSLGMSERLGGTDPRRLLLMARIQAMTGGLNLVIAEVQGRTLSRPDDHQVWRFLGELCLAANRLPMARAAFQRALELNQGSVRIRAALARERLRAGDFASAAALLAPLITDNPFEDSLLFLLGVARQSMGDYSGAVESYRQQLDVNPEHVPALVNLSYVLAEHRGQLDEALQYAEKAKELAWESPEVDDNLGWVLYRRGLSSLAVRHLQDARNHGSTQALAHLAAVRANSPGSNLRDTPVESWSDLGLIDNLAVRKDLYRTATGCESVFQLIPVLTEPDSARFARQALLALMLCDTTQGGTDSVLAKAFHSVAAVPLSEQSKSQWKDPASGLLSFLVISGNPATALASWDSTFSTWNTDHYSIRPDEEEWGDSIYQFTLRSPLDPPDPAGWSVYDSVWPKNITDQLTTSN